MPEVRLVRVFPLSDQGGNPAPIVLDANGMSGEDMREIAASYGHESGFVLPPDPSSEADYRFRFFVPRHEMEMCGHATIGALWLLRKTRRLTRKNIVIGTISGRVDARVPEEGPIAITQPRGTTAVVPGDDIAAILDVLGVREADLAQPTVLNASTSRMKTLIPMRNRGILNSLRPDFARMEALCTDIGSTGLYPFAVGDEPGLFHARQFPCSSGYPEDAATAIAASALAFGLLEWGMVRKNEDVVVRQGDAMGRPSEMTIRFERSGKASKGCWISGLCQLD